MPQKQEPTESRENYLARACHWAERNYIRRSVFSPECWMHTNHEMRIKTLQECEIEFPDLETHGVEVIQRGHYNCNHAPEIIYLNTGDTYGRTVLARGGRWEIGDWGSIVENGNYERAV